MNRQKLWTLIALLSSLLSTACQPLTPQVVASATPVAKYGKAGQGIVSPTAPVEVQIQNALSALPAALAEDATIMGWPVKEGGDMVVLRQGTNGWTCFADWPATWGNDPQCNDAVMNELWPAIGAAGAVGPQVKPNRVGITYMLAGGVDFSNTDPTATQPDPKTGWVVTPPHIHVGLPSGIDETAFSHDPYSGYPFVMWAGTPGAHLHIPVELTPFDEPDPKIHDAMSAAPFAIAKDATILDYPPTGQTKPVVLRNGTNGWTCWTDSPATLTDDPKCLDQTWMAWTEALQAGKAPKIDKLGIGYMLQGGTAASTTDPMAVKPRDDQHWQIVDSAVMLLMPDDLKPADFPTNGSAGGPYIMYAGTPYAFLMVPVLTGDPQQLKAQKEFLQFVLDTEQADESDNVDRIMANYADDVLSLPPGRAAMDKTALRADWQALFATYKWQRTFKLQEYKLVGDYGTRIGVWTNVMTPKAGGDPITEVGRCVLGFKKVNGDWKIAWEIWNDSQ